MGGRNQRDDALDPVVGPDEHPVEHVYSFWYNRRPTGHEARTQENYEKNIKNLGSFASVCGVKGVYGSILLMREC